MAALAATIAGLGAAGVEARHRRQPGNALECADTGWAAERSAADRLQVGGRLVLHNPQQTREVMVRELVPTIRLFGGGPTDELTVEARVHSDDKEYPTRADGNWASYVVKPASYGKDRFVDVRFEVCGPPSQLDALQAAWVTVDFDTYGYEGCRARNHHLMVPLAYPDDPAGADAGADGDSGAAWREVDGGSVLAVRTHLLVPGDDIVEVVARYAAPLARPGDIVAIGESPLAVMQRRMLDPSQVDIGWFASRACQFMSGEGSVGTAVGMQALVDQVGVTRVFAGLVGGVLGKLAGQAGWFYRICGEQSKLIDDVTGTLAPYDRFVVLGPLDSDRVCAEIAASTGLEAVVVDANDLGRVDVIGASDGASAGLVCRALRSNPAGNADEGTPLVLIRPAP